MANKTNTKVNTNNEAVKPNNEAVKPNNEVKGMTNNVGQEIKPMGASDVISCTMTEEEHQARIERITTKMEEGLKLSWDIMVDITSAKERKEQTLDGYSESTEDFNKWAMQLFGMGETQIKQASRVIAFYGSIDGKGEYTLEDKYKRYTKEKLDIIQRLPQLKTKAQFDEVVEALGIMPSTSEGVLKEIVREAKGLPQKDDTQKDTKKDTKKDNKPMDIKDIKDSDVYKTLEEKHALSVHFTTEHIREAMKIAESKDKNQALAFVTKMVDDFKKMEEEYNAIGRKSDNSEETENK